VHRVRSSGAQGTAWYFVNLMAESRGQRSASEEWRHHRPLGTDPASAAPAKQSSFCSVSLRSTTSPRLASAAGALALHGTAPSNATQLLSRWTMGQQPERSARRAGSPAPLLASQRADVVDSSGPARFPKSAHQKHASRRPIAAVFESNAHDRFTAPRISSLTRIAITPAQNSAGPVALDNPTVWQAPGAPWAHHAASSTYALEFRQPTDEAGGASGQLREHVCGGVTARVQQQAADVGGRGAVHTEQAQCSIDPSSEITSSVTQARP
jgi:hypothetical protein